jgi:predicted RNA-binding Zn-ribbon protein involved in translation (DUF1610 family)
MMDRKVMDKQNNQIKCCDECESSYFSESSQMERLCPECAHWLYGYPNCIHEFSEGRCIKCGWDGSVSEYVLELQAQSMKKGKV